MHENLVYAVEDSFYQQNRILTLDVSESPAIVKQAMRILDSKDIFAAIATVAVRLADDDTASFLWLKQAGILMN
jgi:hypothetical protein